MMTVTIWYYIIKDVFQFVYPLKEKKGVILT